ncbi:MAG: Dual-specificity RNA methyltransferase RlmN [Candidatus Anoxychlamydiales bacterium]|nr:Dual-specificity RNA methyltransferase RlmN [Candidatus Anoxychlamydiales bacterium]
MNILDLSIEDIKDQLLKLNEKPFRAKQILEWIYKKNTLNFDQMTNLSISSKENLKKIFKITSINLKKIQGSSDKQTKKYLFKLEDGFLIESVLIISKNRRTICISSQVGCEIKCSFCASGKKGFFRNLSLSEIVEQILYIKKDINDSITNIVFMGMGEPLLNLENVVKAIKVISNENYLNISQRKITLSTSGIVEKINELKEKNLKINLVLSLHASNDEIRKKIMPIASNYKIKDLLSSLKEYFNTTKRDISFEYILIEDFNDSKKHALELVKLLRHFQCTINLIPYNPIESLSYKKPSFDRVREFKKVLDDNKIIVTQRYTKGDDISAACGQLAFKSQ